MGLRATTAQPAASHFLPAGRGYSVPCLPLNQGFLPIPFAPVYVDARIVLVPASALQQQFQCNCQTSRTQLIFNSLWQGY